jgi:hypothetical protein
MSVLEAQKPGGDELVGELGPLIARPLPTPRNPAQHATLLQEAVVEMVLSLMLHMLHMLQFDTHKNHAIVACIACVMVMLTICAIAWALIVR